jgi:uncharacterized protein YndB with AHSA1/START domain
MERPAPLIESSIDIPASPEHVWSLVGDPTASARWSPHVETIVVTTDGPVGVGTRTTNRNRIGDLEWETHAEIIEYTPPQVFAFRMRGSRAVWSFRILPLGDDLCRVVHARSAPDGISESTLELEAAVFGSVAAFEATLADGMAHTLAQLSAEVAAGRTVPDPLSEEQE